MLQVTLAFLGNRLTLGQEPNQVLADLGGVDGALATEVQRLFEQLNPTDRAKCLLFSQSNKLGCRIIVIAKGD